MAQTASAQSRHITRGTKLYAGIRGNHFFMSTPAKCLPSATALGATWDTELIEQAGLKFLAGEAKLRAAPVILAPTCNIQRVRSS
jgi:beta-glucosidase